MSDVVVTSTSKAASSKTMRWVGYVMSGLAVLFMLSDSLIKIIKLPPAVEATTQLGYSEDAIVGIGVLALICLILYSIPRTAVLGAILFTGYLGGAITSQVRVGAPLFNLIFPLIIGALLWGGLYLRDERLRALIPFQR